MNIIWQWQKFQDFNNPAVLYRVLQLRSAIFVVEQRSIYHDMDDKDQQALHLLGWDKDSERLAAYARLFLPSAEKADTPLSFGRVVVDKAYRGSKLGEQLVAQILDYIKTTAYAGEPIEIGAQHYLVAFYGKFGFRVVGEPYDEDGILHVKMLL